MTISLRAPLSTLLPDPIRGAIFDMDGTLIDTEAAQHRSFEAAAAHLGRTMTPDIFKAMIGINRDASEIILAQLMGEDFPVASFFIHADIVLEQEIALGLPLRPGALEILDYFRDTSVRLALATSTAGGLAQERLEKVGLLSYFDVVVTRSDVTNPKPHPEPYLLAAQQLGLSPDQCVAIEDSYAGVQSSTSAGIATIMVPDLMPATDVQRAIVAHVLPSLTVFRDMLRQPASA